MSKTIQLRNKFFLDTEKFTCEIGEAQADSITLFPKDHVDIRMEVFSKNQESNENTYEQDQFEDFVAKIKGTGKVSVDGQFAARSMKLIEEMYRNKLQLDEPWLIYGNEEE